MENDRNRRSACDRCRHHKLRCVRDGRQGSLVETFPLQKMAPCQRCLKAKTVCANSSSSYQQQSLPMQSISQSYGTSSLTDFEEEDQDLQSQFSTGIQPSLHYEHDLSDTISAPIQSGHSLQEALLQNMNFNQGAISQAKETSRGCDKSSNLTAELNEWTDFGHSSWLRKRDAQTMNGHESHEESEVMRPPHSSTFKSPDRQHSMIQKGRTYVSKYLLAEVETGLNNSTHETQNEQNFAGCAPRLSKNQKLSHDTNFRRVSSPLSLDPSVTFMDPLEICKQNLSKLSASLLDDLHQSRSGNMDLCSRDFQAPSFSALKGSSADSEFSPARNAVGRVLNSSQNFLDILQRLKYPSSSSPTRFSSECSYSGDPSDNEDGFWTPISKTPISVNPSNNDSFIPSLQSISSREEQVDAPLKHSTPLVLEIPTVLSILTCYTYILQIYDNIYTQIYTKVMQSSLSSSPLSNIPATLPGLSLGGFSIDNQNHLQMDVLIEISSRMLMRMEKMLGIDPQTNLGDEGAAISRKKGLLSSPSSVAILEVLFQQEELGYLTPDGTRTVHVKKTMETIWNHLRHLEEY
jgi:hypothetical protein